MPTITKFLKDDEWVKGVGPDFFFPKESPHLHLVLFDIYDIKAEDKEEDIYEDLRMHHTKGFFLTNRDGKRNLNLVKASPAEIKEAFDDFFDDAEVRRKVKKRFENITGYDPD